MKTKKKTINQTKNNKNIFGKFSAIFVLFFVLITSHSVFAAEDFSSLEVSLVNQDPSSVIAGSIVEVRIGIENVGYSIAQDVIIEAVSQYPFEVISQKIQSIGSIQSSNSDGSNIQIIKFKLKTSESLTAGTHTLTLKEYEKSSPNIVTEHKIEIDVKTKESLEIISIDKTEILPGKKEALTFQLKNVGSSVLKDIIFSWENVNGVILPVGSDNSVYVNSIPIGETIEITFDVLASSSVVADLYDLDLKISYQDAITGTQNEHITKAGIYIGGNTAFDLVFDEFSSNQYSFTISNIGATNAESVTIKIPNQDGWKINSGNSQIIGNLNKGDYTTVSFDLTKIKGNSINLIIDYSNTLSERISIEKTVDIITQDNQNSTGTGTGTFAEKRAAGGMKNVSSGISNIFTFAKYFGYAFVILLVLLIGRKIYKKRKN